MTKTVIAASSANSRQRKPRNRRRGKRSEGMEKKTLTVAVVDNAHVVPEAGRVAQKPRGDGEVASERVVSELGGPAAISRR